MTMVHEQIREAAKSLEKRRKFETGWYEQRIKVLEAERKILRNALHEIAIVLNIANKALEELK